MDLLRLPVLGAVLRWRRLRLTMQLALLAVAAALVAHGLFGPQVGPRNLATVTTSIHWRGLLVIGLLIAGNVFCAACPMVLARDAGRRVFHAQWRWPRRLRGKWLGILLLVGVLYAYELFDVWSLPAATAWIILGYFGAALAVDMLFAGAVFCKHLCPIGQFNFVASTVSPTELRIISRDTCRTCGTVDCIRGRAGIAADPAVVRQRGCELALFLPAKVGNLDCTLCFDCVRACPHDNIALVTRAPGAELLHAGRRSGIGTLARRPDLAMAGRRVRGGVARVRVRHDRAGERTGTACRERARRHVGSAGAGHPVRGGCAGAAGAARPARPPPTTRWRSCPSASACGWRTTRFTCSPAR